MSYIIPKRGRTIKSLIRQCVKRYPVPMTAWQIGRIIRRNPASVSSKLCEMRKTGEILCFIGKRKQLLYATNDLNGGVQIVYSITSDLKCHPSQY